MKSKIYKITLYYMFIFLIFTNLCYSSDKNLPLRDVLLYLANTHNVNFVYHDELIDNISINCNLKRNSLQEILDKISETTDITFQTLPPESIVLYKDDSKLTCIQGYVLDASDEQALPYTNIILKGTTNGTASDLNGHFKIAPISTAPCTLAISHIAYNPNEIIINPSNEANPIQVKLEQRAIEGEEVVVTVDKFKTIELSAKPGEMRIFPKQMNLIDKVDLFRTIQTLPGISIGFDKPTHIYLHGGASNENLVLFDEIPIHIPEHYFGFVSPFPACAVEKISIYKGCFPVQYGDCLSGIIDFTGNSVQDKKFNIGVGADIFSGYAFVELPVKNIITGFFSYRQSHNNMNQGKYYTNIGKFVRNDIILEEESYELPEFSFSDFIWKITIKPTKNDKFSVTSYQSIDEGKNEKYYRENLSSNEWQNKGISSKWSHIWNSRLKSNISLIYSDFMDETEVIISERSKNHSKLENKIIKFNNNFTLSRFKVQIGTEYSEFCSYFGGDDYNEAYSKALKTILFGNNNIKVNDNLEFDLRVRAIKYSKTDKYYYAPSASFTLSWFGNISLKGSWGYYHQFISEVPSLIYSTLPIDRIGRSNENNKVSNVKKNLLELNYDNKNFKVKLAAYHKNYNNLSIGTYVLPRFRHQLNEFGTGTAKGIETALQKTTGHFTGVITYNWGRVEYDLPYFNQGRTFPAVYNRQHEFKALFNYSKQNWNCSIIGILTSGNQYSKPSKLYNLDFKYGGKYYVYDRGFNANRFPNYRRIDLNISKVFKMPLLNNMEIGLLLFNILNHKNLIGRQYIVNYHYITTFDTHTLGFTPMLYFNAKLR